MTSQAASRVQSLVEFRLLRDTYSREMGTFGTLSVYLITPDPLGPPQLIGDEVLPDTDTKLFECETVERPWANNAPYISCIPEGTYETDIRQFYRGGYETWELLKVPNRTHILIHKGNVATDVQGCIAVGRRRAVLNGAWSVRGSGEAFAELREKAKGYDPPKIIISQHRPMPPYYLSDSRYTPDELKRLRNANPGDIVMVKKP